MYDLDYEVVPETPFYSDDEKLICDLLMNEWALGPENKPTFVYEKDAYMIDARQGSVCVEMYARPMNISSVDYQTMNRTSMVSIKLSTRNRDKHFEWGNEIYRILFANRRPAPGKLGLYTYMEPLRDNKSRDLNGWYTTVIDVRLTGYCVPIKSAGFGNTINKQIDDSITNGDSQ